VRSAAPNPHVVVSEVYANPRGAEPAQEWIELFDDATVGVDLSGWQLEVNGTASTLPEGTSLAEGAYALVVAAAFADDDGVDPAPAPGTLVVRVPKLGRSGLSNDGAFVALRDAQGGVVSRFPAVPRPREGVSVVRVAPEAPDDAPASFALDANGSATPGAPNDAP
jgi:hypothetical protein